MSFQDAIIKIATDFAKGGRLTEIDLIAIGISAEVYNIKPEYLPGPKTISGKPEDRKAEIFRLATALWGVSPAHWLELENNWQKSARVKSGSEETKGKDDLNDVISAEILLRILATSRILMGSFGTKIPNNDLVKKEAIDALNLILGEAVSKGRTRINRVDGKTVYSILKDQGVMIGTGGGKYLPDPDTSLPYLFGLLRRSNIIAHAYFR